MRTQNIGVSVFFPAYNDAPTIPRLVRDAINTLERITDDYEVIIVNDGSKDNTAEVAERLAKRHAKVRVVHHASNRGYGGALKTGFEAAKKEYVFYTDGDGQYDVKEMAALVKELHRADLVSGYHVKRADSLSRVVFGRMYYFAARILFNIRMKHVDCDFRIMRRSIFDKVRLESNSGVICVEMLKKIQDAGFRIVEVPVHHYPRSHGRSQFFRPSKLASTLCGLARLWVELVLLRALLRRA